MHKRGFTPLEMRKASSIDYGNALIRISRKKRFLSLTGFTLMEVVMATVILSIIMIGLVSVFVSGKKLVRHSSARITAAELGKLFLDPLQMKIRQDTWASDCIAKENCANQTQGTASGLDREYNVQYYIINGSNNNAPLHNLNRVKAVITWTENESP